jgi:hypothetical protein
VRVSAHARVISLYLNLNLKIRKWKPPPKNQNAPLHFRPESTWQTGREWQ